VAIEIDGLLIAIANRIVTDIYAEKPNSVLTQVVVVLALHFQILDLVRVRR
jgi:hypothetical protein